MYGRTGHLHRLAPAVVLGTLGLAACGETAPPTSPDIGEATASASAAAAAPNSWTPRAPIPIVTEPGEEFFGYTLAETVNSAGQSIVYAMGGSFPARGGAGGSRVRTYNVASDTWTGGVDVHVGVFHSNGAARIGNKFYLSGGYNEPGSLPTFENRLRLFDLAAARSVEKADMPIFGAEGVTGVIGGKLYVFPGACSGDLYPNPGYCEKEATRRLFRYDPGTNAWTTLRRAPNYHRQGAAAVLDGKFYVAGGVGESFEALAHLDVYDPKTNTWRTLAPLPTAGRASGVSLQGRFFVVVNGQNGIRAYAYNPATNRWQPRAAPGFRGSMVRVTLDGQPRVFMAESNLAALYTP